MATVGWPPSIRLDRVTFLPGLSCLSFDAAGPTPIRTRLFLRILRPSESVGRLETTRFFQSTTSRARRLPAGSTSLPDVRFQSWVKMPTWPLGTSGWLRPLTVQARRCRIVYCTDSGLTCGPVVSNHSDELTPGIQPSRSGVEDAALAVDRDAERRTGLADVEEVAVDRADDVVPAAELADGLAAGDVLRGQLLERDVGRVEVDAQQVHPGLADRLATVDLVPLAEHHAGRDLVAVVVEGRGSRARGRRPAGRPRCRACRPRSGCDRGRCRRPAPTTWGRRPAWTDPGSRTWPWTGRRSGRPPGCRRRRRPGRGCGSGGRSRRQTRTPQ